MSDDGEILTDRDTCKNISGLTITALSYSIQARYPDGSTNSAGGGNVDSVALLLPGNEKGAFAPGVINMLTADIPLDSRGAVPVAAEVTLRMLVFDDRSAIGDAGEISRVALSRRGNAKMMSDVLDAVGKALQSPDPKREMDALLAKHRSEGMVWVQLGPLFDHGPAAMDAVLSSYRATRDLFLRQSELKQQDSPPAK